MIKVKLIRSKIGCTPKQRRILAAMGLARPHSVKTMQDNPAMRGMIKHVQHMVEVME
jgi:ribosomal protein L30, bacterial/organelle